MQKNNLYIAKYFLVLKLNFIRCTQQKLSAKKNYQDNKFIIAQRAF